MATLIKMPEVAAGATEIVLSKWQVAVGASVKVGDIIAEMETEKAVVDYAADTEGTVYDDALERRRMTFAVSRYLKQAKQLIANAERGVFPCIKPVSN